MKKLLTIIPAVIFCLSFSVSTSSQTLREAFTAMPDSLLPTLTKNNRLDMIDFMDAKMKAAVTNLLEGQSVMTFLSDDSLAIRMSDAMTVEMKLEHFASTHVSPASPEGATVLLFKRTYATKGGGHQTLLTRYDAATWNELAPATITESTLQGLDDQISTAKPIASHSSQLTHPSHSSSHNLPSFP